jgi:hypothetical protein
MAHQPMGGQQHGFPSNPRGMNTGGYNRSQGQSHNGRAHGGHQGAGHGRGGGGGGPQGPGGFPGALGMPGRAPMPTSALSAAMAAAQQQQQQQNPQQPQQAAPQRMASGALDPAQGMTDGLNDTAQLGHLMAAAAAAAAAGASGPAPPGAGLLAAQSLSNGLQGMTSLSADHGMLSAAAVYGRNGLGSVAGIANSGGSVLSDNRASLTAAAAFSPVHSSPRSTPGLLMHGHSGMLNGQEQGSLPQEGDLVNDVALRLGSLGTQAAFSLGSQKSGADNVPHMLLGQRAGLGAIGSSPRGSSLSNAASNGGAVAAHLSSPPRSSSPLGTTGPTATSIISTVHSPAGTDSDAGSRSDGSADHEGRGGRKAIGKSGRSVGERSAADAEAPVLLS